MRSFSATDIGQKRRMNQDYMFSSDKTIGKLPDLYIVADGMGGHKAGDFASRFTVEKLVEYISGSAETDPRKLISKAIVNANTMLFNAAMADYDMEGCGTTLVIASVFADKAVIANIGDSRLYIVGQDIRQITEDNSLVEEMIKAGSLNRKDARNHPDRNVITRAVGVEKTVETDFYEVKLNKGELIMICTDGLTAMIEDEDILKIINSNDTLETKASELIAAANSSGGRDNITVTLIDAFN